MRVIIAFFFVKDGFTTWAPASWEVIAKVLLAVTAFVIFILDLRRCSDKQAGLTLIKKIIEINILVTFFESSVRLKAAYTLLSPKFNA